MTQPLFFFYHPLAAYVKKALSVLGVCHECILNTEQLCNMDAYGIGGVKPHKKLLSDSAKIDSEIGNFAGKPM